MKSIMLLIASCILAINSFAQTSYVKNERSWTEADRQYLVDNLTRSRDEVINETKGLTEAQWNFKESPERWSIAQIVNHIAIWELLLQREISQAFNGGPRPELSSGQTDSVVYGFIYETHNHISNEYTKPFTFAQPSTQNGKSSVEWLSRMRNESIDFVKSTDKDIRVYYAMKGRGNIHQVYITTFGHTDRHLRQIRKVKADKNFPK